MPERAEDASMAVFSLFRYPGYSLALVLALDIAYRHPHFLHRFFGSCKVCVWNVYIVERIYIYRCLSTLGHSKRRETRGDTCEDEARGRWAVRSRAGGRRRDGVSKY